MSSSFKRTIFMWKSCSYRLFTSRRRSKWRVIKIRYMPTLRQRQSPAGRLPKWNLKSVWRKGLRSELEMVPRRSEDPGKRLFLDWPEITNKSELKRIRPILIFGSDYNPLVAKVDTSKGVEAAQKVAISSTMEQHLMAYHVRIHFKRIR